MTKKKTNSPLRHFIATWTHSQVYTLTAATFDQACEKALADRTLYTAHTVDRLTIRQLHKKENTT